MGRFTLEDASALTTTKPRVKIPKGKYSRLLVRFYGDAKSGESLTPDSIAELSLNRHLPGTAARKAVQEISFTEAHRISRYEARGSVVLDNPSGGEPQLDAFLDQYTPTLPDNVMHVTDPDDAILKLDLDVDETKYDSLRYKVIGITNPAGVEYYVRRLDTTELDMQGSEKERSPTGNIAALYLRDPSSVIADEGINVTKHVGSREMEILEDLSYDDVETINQESADIPDSGLLDRFTKVLATSGRELEEHVSDYVEYEIDSDGAGTVLVTTDKVDFGAAFNERSATEAVDRAQDLMRASQNPMTQAAVRRAAMQG